MTDEIITLEVTFTKRGKPLRPHRLAGAVHALIEAALYSDIPGTEELDATRVRLDGVVVSGTGFRIRL